MPLSGKSQLKVDRDIKKRRQRILQRTVGKVRLNGTIDRASCPTDVSCSSSFSQWLL
jgi:hypothetical protein